MTAMVALSIGIAAKVTNASPLSAAGAPFAVPIHRIASLSDHGRFSGPFVSWPPFKAHAGWTVSVRYSSCNSHGRSFRVSILGVHPRFTTTLLDDHIGTDNRTFRVASGGTYRLKVVIPDKETGCDFRVTAGYP